MTLLGGTALAGAGSFGAASDPDGAAGNQPTDEGRGKGADGEASARKWNKHVDAQGHDLRNLGSLDVAHTHTEARDADVVVWRDQAGTYHADCACDTVHSSEDYFETIQAALDSLDDDRQSARTVLVVSSGTVGPVDELTQLILPSDVVLDVPATIYVEDEGERLVTPIRAFGEENITIPRLSIRGNPRFGVWIQNSDDVTMGEIDVRFENLDAFVEYTEPDTEWPPVAFDPDASKEEILNDRGYVGDPHEAIRVDGRARDAPCENVRIQDVYVEGANHHGVELYSAQNVVIGSVIAKDQGSAAVILNETFDAAVNSVVGNNPDSPTWYATFRCANGCENVSVGQVVSRDAPRGVHVTTGSDEVTIGEVNIVGARYTGIKVDDVENFTVQGGVVKNVIEQAVVSWECDGFSVSNLRIVDDLSEAEREEMYVPPGSPSGREQTRAIEFAGQNGRIVNNDVRDGGSEELITVDSPSTVVTGNVGDGVASGRATLETGGTEAARISTDVDYASASLELRASALTAPNAAFAWDHRFEYDGDAWEVVVEWVTDPGEDVEIDYIVDQPQAIRSSTRELPGLAEGTYRITSAINDDDVVVSVDDEAGLTDGANVYMDTVGEAANQQWTVTELEDGVYRIAAADDPNFVLETDDGGTDTGTNLVIGEWADADYQRFSVSPSAPGRYPLEPTHAELAVDVWEQDSDPGADLRHWSPSDAANQIFRFDEQ